MIEEDSIQLGVNMDSLEAKRFFYPRVSEIISKQNQNELRSIPIETLVNASIRGKAVHSYCTTYMRKLFMPEIEPAYLPYVDAFIYWFDRNVVKVLDTSRRFYDDTLKFSGEFDAVVILKDSDLPTLIDIKATAAKSKTWPLQLAAYRHLCQLNNFTVHRAMNIHLKVKTPGQYDEKEGQKVLVSAPVVIPKEVPCDDLTGAWNIFSSALACYDYFDRKEV